MYNKYVDVNKKFKSSVNLEYDLKNEDKILEYVPTTDLCDVLYNYLDAVLSNNSVRSTLLVGPYGKGKSYLMLMLTYLLSKRENRELFNIVVSRIAKINNKLADLIIELDNNKVSLLPIIINNNADEDFNNLFLIGLKNALKDNNLTKLIPNSTYNEALKIVRVWKQEEQKGKFIISNYLTDFNYTIKDLEKGLKEYNQTVFNTFRKLFKEISHGLEFNSLTSNDIASLYADVSNKITDYGYNGLFIIYDEFGVFLENQTSDFSIKLNKLQNLAERCNASQERQMHLCCICHKDFVLYSKDDKKSNDFAKIAGRFKTIRFNRSLEENYEIIADAIKKKEGYNELVLKFINNNKEFINNILNSNFLKEKELDFLFKNTFPFNPLSVIALINVSENVGQNERTVFTYLTDTNETTFKYFIKNNNENLLNVDLIYDYFKDVIKNNSYYENIYNTITSLEQILNKKLAIRIIKALAIFKIINDDIKFAPSIYNLALALNANYIEVKEEINNLIINNYLKTDILTNYINFSSLDSLNIIKKLNEIVSTKLLSYKIDELLNLISEQKYYVSNKYNSENEMTRYFLVTYMMPKEILSISDICNYPLMQKGDGLIINIINVDDIDILKFKEKLKEFKVLNLIFRVINKDIPKEVINKAQLFKASNILLASKDIANIEKETLTIYQNEIKSELNRYLKKLDDNGILLSNSSNAKTINKMIEECLIKTYYKMVVFINEQINKDEISAVSQKARNKIGDVILQITNKDFSKTSLEQTILTSFEDSIENNKSIIKEIISIIIKDSKVDVSQISNLLKKPPYGMRYGVMPLFLAKAISEITSYSNGNKKAVILYHYDKEIPLNTANLNLALKEENYSISSLDISLNTYDVLCLFSKELGCKETTNLGEMVNNIVLALRNDFYNYDQVISTASEDDNVIKLNELELKYKKLIRQNDINSFELLFIKLPSLFKTEIGDVINKIKEIRLSYISKANKYYDSLLSYVKELFNTNDSIKEGFNSFLIVNNLKEISLSTKYKSIYNELINSSNDDNKTLSRLAIIIVRSNITSFNKLKDEKFKTTLKEFKDYLANYKIVDVLDDVDEVKLSFMGETLLSNLEETLNEYGEAISVEEKKQILKTLLRGVN